MTKKAFTLIEMLIVIVIILILASMTMIAISSLRTNASVAATTGLIGRIEIALKTYQVAFLEYPPDNDGTYKDSQCLWYYLYEGSADEDLENPKAFRTPVRAPDPRTGEAGIYKKFPPAIGPEGFKKKELQGNPPVIVDAWGQPLRYKNPGGDHSEGDTSKYRCRNNTKYVDLESSGPDMTSDTDDDITNWRIQK